MTQHRVVMAGGTGGHIFPGLAVARGAARARLERALAGRARQHGEPAGAAARLRARHHRLQRPARQGPAAHADRRRAPAEGVLATASRILRRARRRRGARHGRLRLLPRRADGVAARQAAGAGQRRRVAAAGATSALLPVADRVAFGFDGARRGDDQARASSPATRCAPRSRRCPRRPSASPAAAGRCACWWSAAAWARRRSTQCVPQALALLAAERAPARCTHQSGAKQIDAAARQLRRTPASQAEVAALHRRHGRSALADCDLIVCRAGASHRQRAVRRRRRRRAGAAGRQHHVAPARQRALAWRRTAPAIHLPQTELTPRALADAAARRWTRDALLRDGRQGARAGASRSAAARVADETRTSWCSAHEARRQAHPLRRRRRRRHERHRRDPAQPGLHASRAPTWPTARRRGGWPRWASRVCDRPRRGAHRRRRRGRHVHRGARPTTPR